MRSTTSRRWSEKDYEYIRKNIEQGTLKLSEYFGVSITAFHNRCSIIGVELRQNKELKPDKPSKMDNAEKFCSKRHKIKNNSIVGKIPFKIPNEKMTVYICPTKDSDQYRQSIVQKYANRHKSI